MVKSERGIEHRVAWNFIRYGNCWEDADVLCAGLQPAPGKRFLSICSAGDNVLALLAEGAEVVAADLNATQLACLELRCAAFRRLTHEQLLSFVGVLPDQHRGAVYDQLSDQLSPPSRRFWDAHRPLIENGIIHAGKMEAYFRAFRRWVLPWIHSRRTVDELLRPKSRPQRERFWRSKWDNFRWRILFRLFFSRAVMQRLGRDPQQFRFVEGSVADRILERAELALTTLPTDTNPYLQYIARGNFEPALPRYLRPEYFDRIRQGLSRLTWAQGRIEQVGKMYQGAGFDGMNLSDIFEYLDERESERLYGELLDLCRPAARLVYWNTLVPRACPLRLQHRVAPLNEIAEQLFAGDKAFFYNAFHVEEVTGSLPVAAASSSCSNKR